METVESVAWKMAQTIAEAEQKVGARLDRAGWLALVTECLATLRAKG